MLVSECSSKEEKRGMGVVLGMRGLVKVLRGASVGTQAQKML